MTQNPYILLLQPEKEDSQKIFDLVSHSVILEFPNAIIKTIQRLQYIYKPSPKIILDSVSKADLVIGNMDGGNQSVVFGLDFAISKSKPILLIVETGRASSIPPQFMDLRLFAFNSDDTDHFINNFRYEVRQKLETKINIADEPSNNSILNVSKAKMNVLDNYEFEKQIGAGYFSNVNRYYDKRTNQKVAVKRLKKNFKDNANYIHRFEREINLLKELADHPNIIELIAEGSKDERPFYIMPAAETNLDKYISIHNSTLNDKERMFLFEQTLEAISYAHSKSILHRDISPNNVLLFENNGEKLVKVSDFGLGKNWGQDSAFTYSVTANYGQRVYTAPEQFNKLKDASERSDIYSLGKLLDYLLTGKHPHVIYSTGGFKVIIEKATSPEPENRYETVDEFKTSYKAIKNILLPDEDIDITELIKFTNEDGSIDWHKFHRFAVKGEYLKSIFNEYISVIIEISKDETNLKNYVSIAPDGGRGFAETFRQRIIDLPPTGWSFRTISDFSSVFFYIYFFTTDVEIKFLCLQEMWKFAYEWDQYGSQSVIQKVINENQIPQILQDRFAVEILNSKAKDIDINDFKDSMPSSIKRAIIEKIKQS